jgi:uncharacterized membrane protein
MTCLRSTLPNPRLVLPFLAVALLGSQLNIPITSLVYGVMNINAPVDGGLAVARKLLLINVGGALLPAVFSVYLLIRRRLLVPGLAGILIVAVVLQKIVAPTAGIGITAPFWIAPLLAGVTASFLGGRHRIELAYIAGSIGTLLGADLMNLDAILEMKESIASIGGMGVADGIFMCGPLAVFIVRLGKGILRISSPVLPALQMST